MSIDNGVPFAAYLALPSVHFSTLKEMDKSPLHYRHACEHERRDTDALRLGRILHALVLTPDVAEVAIFDGPVRRGKAWDAFAAENADKVILRAEELSVAHRMRDAVYSHPEARALLTGGSGEVTVQWRDAETGVDCRCRVDYLRRGGQMVELKSTRQIHPRAFASAFARMLYHAQVGFYRAGLRANGLNPIDALPAVIAVENTAPYDVAVYRIGDAECEAGDRKWVEWLRRVAECNASGRWPGVAPSVLDMRLPAWATGDDEDVPDIMIGGEEMP